MRCSSVLGVIAVAAVLAGFAALAYVAYNVITGLWAMFVTLLLVMAIGVTGDVSALPSEVYWG